MTVRARLIAALLALVVLCSLPTPGLAATQTRVSLLLDASAVRPGDTVQAGVRLQMAPGWHTYWRNSGESGAPPTLDWQLPDGITAGAIQWPVPEKHDADGLTTYILTEELVLLVPLRVAANTPAGPKELKVSVAWLECATLCVPAKAEAGARLVVADAAQSSPDADLLKADRTRLPQPGGALKTQARWGELAADNTRPLLLQVANRDVKDFFPYENSMVEFESPTARADGPDRSTSLRKTAKRIGTAWPQTIEGLILTTAGGKTTAYEIDAPVSSGDKPAAALPATAGQPLGLMLVFAFVGGLILNVMPCVLPVIALKILGFVNQSRSAPARVRKLGLVYGAGVLASFLVLASVVIAVKAAGQRASWGMQFGNPIFIVLLTTLVTLVALNLFGLFEVTLGGNALSAASELAGREGPAGAFFNGVLATALATPCTAPFLGAALGFAFAQPAAIIVVVFLTVGLGLALPYVLLSWNPAWLRFLPKPGAWMERFKIAMGFPMLATAVWLFTLAGEHYGDVFWLGIFLVTVALAAWVFGEFVQRGRSRKGLAAGIAAAFLAFGYGYGLETELRWRTPPAAAPDSADGVLQEQPGGIEWRRWSAEAVAKARAEGRPVFVDFTAKWCVTCNANKKTSIEIPSVREKLTSINAVALLGDYTKVPPAITDELARFGRAGVPLVLVYPKDATKPPMVLPELLTPGIILDALDKAAE